MMAGLVGYVVLAILGPYMVLALLPPGWLAGGAVALGLAAGAIGWFGGQDRLPDGLAVHLGQPELVFIGLGAGLAALVRSVRLVFPALRIFGGYGLLVLVAPFVAFPAAVLIFGPQG
jgi:hypothetical protein